MSFLDYFQNAIKSFRHDTDDKSQLSCTKIVNDLDSFFDKISDNPAELIEALGQSFEFICKLPVTKTTWIAILYLGHYIFMRSARVVLGILDGEDEKLVAFKTKVNQLSNFNQKLDNEHPCEVLFKSLGWLIENLWSDPTLISMMQNEEPIEKQEVLDYFSSSGESAEVFKLRVEMMIADSCESFALNLCNSCVLSPVLRQDVFIRQAQLLLSHKFDRTDDFHNCCNEVECCTAKEILQRVFHIAYKDTSLETVKSYPGCIILSNICSEEEIKSLSLMMAQTFLVHDWMKPATYCCTKDLLRYWVMAQRKAEQEDSVFVTSITKVSSIASTTKQLVIFVSVVYEQVGDICLQLCSELLQKALKLDRHQLDSARVLKEEAKASEAADSLAATCRSTALLYQHHKQMYLACLLTAIYLEPKDNEYYEIQNLFSENTAADLSSVSGKIPHSVDEATFLELHEMVETLRPSLMHPQLGWQDVKSQLLLHLDESGYIFNEEANSFIFISNNHNKVVDTTDNNLLQNLLDSKVHCLKKIFETSLPKKFEKLEISTPSNFLAIKIENQNTPDILVAPTNVISPKNDCQTSSGKNLLNGNVPDQNKRDLNSKTFEKPTLYHKSYEQEYLDFISKKSASAKSILSLSEKVVSSNITPLSVSKNVDHKSAELHSPGISDSSSVDSSQNTSKEVQNLANAFSGQCLNEPSSTTSETNSLSETHTDNRKSYHSETEHSITCEKQKPSLSCKYCDQTFLTFIERRRHQEWLCSEKPDLSCNTADSFKCNVCLKSFENELSLRRHVSTFHADLTVTPGSDPSPHNCGVCFRSFRSNILLHQHKSAFHSASSCGKNGEIVQNNGRNFVCEICSKSYGLLRSLKRHIYTMHPDDLHILPAKRKGRPSKSFSIQSLNKVSGAKKPFKLSSNDFIKRPSNLKSNFANTNGTAKNIFQQSLEKVFICQNCQKRFNSKSLIDAHINECSKNNLQLFSCSLCSEQFRGLISLNNHTNLAHTDRVPSLKVANQHQAPNGSDKILQKTVVDIITENRVSLFKIQELKCCGCRRDFGQRSLIRTHFTESSCDGSSGYSIVYKFQCSYCFKCFLSRKVCIQHLEKCVAKSGETGPLHTCFFCDFTTPSQLVLTTHIALHSFNQEKFSGTNGSKTPDKNSGGNVRMHSGSASPSSPAALGNGSSETDMENCNQPQQQQSVNESINHEKFPEKNESETHDRNFGGNVQMQSKGASPTSPSTLENGSLEVDMENCDQQQQQQTVTELTTSLTQDNKTDDPPLLSPPWSSPLLLPVTVSMPVLTSIYAPSSPDSLYNLAKLQISSLLYGISFTLPPSAYVPMQFIDVSLRKNCLPGDTFVYSRTPAHQPPVADKAVVLKPFSSQHINHHLTAIQPICFSIRDKMHRNLLNFHLASLPIDTWHRISTQLVNLLRRLKQQIIPPSSNLPISKILPKNTKADCFGSKLFLIELFSSFICLKHHFTDVHSFSSAAGISFEDFLFYMSVVSLYSSSLTTGAVPFPYQSSISSYLHQSGFEIDAESVQTKTNHNSYINQQGSSDSSLIIVSKIVNELISEVVSGENFMDFFYKGSKFYKVFYYFCTNCKEVFSNRSLCEEHIHSVSTCPKNASVNSSFHFFCPVCGLSFCSIHSHFNDHHRPNGESVPLSQLSESEVIVESQPHTKFQFCSLFKYSRISGLANKHLQKFSRSMFFRNPRPNNNFHYHPKIHTLPINALPLKSETKSVMIGPGKKFSNKSNSSSLHISGKNVLATHENSVPNDLPLLDTGQRFSCPDCHLAFITEKLLASHRLNTCQEKLSLVHRCAICDSQFMTKESLGNHVMERHHEELQKEMKQSALGVFSLTDSNGQLLVDSHKDSSVSLNQSNDSEVRLNNSNLRLFVDNDTELLTTNSNLNDLDQLIKDSEIVLKSEGTKELDLKKNSSLRNRKSKNPDKRESKGIAILRQWMMKHGYAINSSDGKGDKIVYQCKYCGEIKPLLMQFHAHIMRYHAEEDKKQKLIKSKDEFVANNLNSELKSTKLDSTGELSNTKNETISPNSSASSFSQDSLNPIVSPASLTNQINETIFSLQTSSENNINDLTQIDQQNHHAVSSENNMISFPVDGDESNFAQSCRLDQQQVDDFLNENSDVICKSEDLNSDITPFTTSSICNTNLSQTLDLNPASSDGGNEMINMQPMMTFVELNQPQISHSMDSNSFELNLDTDGDLNTSAHRLTCNMCDHDSSFDSLDALRAHLQWTHSLVIELPDMPNTEFENQLNTNQEEVSAPEAVQDETKTFKSDSCNTNSLNQMAEVDELQAKSFLIKNSPPKTDSNSAPAQPVSQHAPPALPSTAAILAAHLTSLKREKNNDSGQSSHDEATSTDSPSKISSSLGGLTPVYTCQLCDKSFKFQSRYLEHVRVHSNIRPYKCRMCDHTYKYRFDLQHHYIRSHLNIKKGATQCTVCKIQCSDSRNLLKHVKQLHTAQFEDTCDESADSDQQRMSSSNLLSDSPTSSPVAQVAGAVTFGEGPLLSTNDVKTEVKSEVKNELKNECRDSDDSSNNLPPISALLGVENPLVVQQQLDQSSRSSTPQNLNFQHDSPTHTPKQQQNPAATLHTGLSPLAHALKIESPVAKRSLLGNRSIQVTKQNQSPQSQVVINSLTGKPVQVMVGTQNIFSSPKSLSVTPFVQLPEDISSGNTSTSGQVSTQNPDAIMSSPIAKIIRSPRARLVTSSQTGSPTKILTSPQRVSTSVAVPRSGSPRASPSSKRVRRTSSKSDAESTGNVSSGGEKGSIQCKYCDRSFAFASKYEEHMPVHSDLRPYVCTICNRSYKYKHDLAVHMGTHMGIPPKAKKCLFCGREFESTRSLRGHVEENHLGLQEVLEGKVKNIPIRLFRKDAPPTKKEILEFQRIVKKQRSKAGVEETSEDTGAESAVDSAVQMHGDLPEEQLAAMAESLMSSGQEVEMQSSVVGSTNSTLVAAIKQESTKFVAASVPAVVSSATDSATSKSQFKVPSSSQSAMLESINAAMRVAQTVFNSGTTTPANEASGNPLQLMSLYAGIKEEQIPGPPLPQTFPDLSQVISYDQINSVSSNSDCSTIFPSPNDTLSKEKVVKPPKYEKARSCIDISSDLPENITSMSVPANLDNFELMAAESNHSHDEESNQDNSVKDEQSNKTDKSSDKAGASECDNSLTEKCKANNYHPTQFNNPAPPIFFKQKQSCLCDGSLAIGQKPKARELSGKSVENDKPIKRPKIGTRPRKSLRRYDQDTSSTSDSEPDNLCDEYICTEDDQEKTKVRRSRSRSRSVEARPELVLQGDVDSPPAAEKQAHKKFSFENNVPPSGESERYFLPAPFHHKVLGSFIGSRSTHADPEIYSDSSDEGHQPFSDSDRESSGGRPSDSAFTRRRFRRSYSKVLNHTSPSPMVTSPEKDTAICRTDEVHSDDNNNNQLLKTAYIEEINTEETDGITRPADDIPDKVTLRLDVSDFALSSITTPFVEHLELQNLSVKMFLPALDSEDRDSTCSDSIYSDFNTNSLQSSKMVKLFSDSEDSSCSLHTFKRKWQNLNSCSTAINSKLSKKIQEIKPTEICSNTNSNKMHYKTTKQPFKFAEKAYHPCSLVFLSSCQYLKSQKIKTYVKNKNSNYSQQVIVDILEDMMQTLSQDCNKITLFKPKFKIDHSKPNHNKGKTSAPCQNCSHSSCEELFHENLPKAETSELYRSIPQLLKELEESISDHQQIDNSLNSPLNILKIPNFTSLLPESHELKMWELSKRDLVGNKSDESSLRHLFTPVCPNVPANTSDCFLLFENIKYCAKPQSIIPENSNKIRPTTDSSPPDQNSPCHFNSKIDLTTEESNFQISEPDELLAWRLSEPFRYENNERTLHNLSNHLFFPDSLNPDSLKCAASTAYYCANVSSPSEIKETADVLSSRSLRHSTHSSVVWGDEYPKYTGRAKRNSTPGVIHSFKRAMENSFTHY